MGSREGYVLIDELKDYLYVGLTSPSHPKEPETSLKIKKNTGTLTKSRKELRPSIDEIIPTADIKQTR